MAEDTPQLNLDDVPEMVAKEMARQLQAQGLSEAEIAEGVEFGRQIAATLIDVSKHPVGCPCDLCTALFKQVKNSLPEE